MDNYNYFLFGRYFHKKKTKLPEIINLSETLDHIDSTPQYTVVNLNPDILRVAEDIDFHELHDRLILATAKWLGVSVISSDRKFAAVEGVEVVWD